MRIGKRASSGLAFTALVGAIGLVTGGSVVNAGPPLISHPQNVYTPPGTPLAFAGVDPISLEARDVGLTTDFDDSSCVVTNPGDEGHSGDCESVQVSLPGGPTKGTMTIDDSSIGYVGSNRSGDAQFAIVGNQADVQAAIATMTYAPPDPTFETPTGSYVALHVTLSDPSQSSKALVRIHVRGDNDPPIITVPSGSPFEVGVGEDFVFAEPGTEIFSMTDDDIPKYGPNVEQVLGFTWVACGSLSFPAPNPQMYGWPFGDPAGFATPAEIPVEVPPGLPYAAGFDHVAAAAWSASQNVFNHVISEITFHAPGVVGPCTLTIVVSDLGSNAMPLPGKLPDPLVAVVSVVFNVVETVETSTTTTTPPVCPTTTTSSPTVTTKPPVDSTTTVPSTPTTTVPDTDPTTTVPATTTTLVIVTTTTDPQRTTTTVPTTTIPTNSTTTTIPGVPPGITFVPPTNPPPGRPAGFAGSGRPVQPEPCVPPGDDPGDPGNPGDPGDPGVGTLPATGADVTTLGVIAGLMVLGGAVLLAGHRRL